MKASTPLKSGTHSVPYEIHSPVLNLNSRLREWGITKSALAKGVGVSVATISLICNRDHWPQRPTRKALQRDLEAWLRERLAEDDIHPTGAEWAALWQPAAWLALSGAERVEEQTTADPGGSPDRPGTPGRGLRPLDDEVIDMLLAKQSLTQQAKKHFGLFRDPFDEIQDAEDVFRSPAIRLVWEHLLATARSGGFLAVVGESGSGKSTLVDDIEDTIVRDGLPVALIRPYVVGMEGDDTRGKRLKAAAILDAILRAVAPTRSPPRDLQNKAARCHEALIASHQAGLRHCLVIDEAHRLAAATLKHLKGFYELKLGHAKLLSIILIGQPELRLRLDERNPELREVTQRCELRELPALDEALEPFLAHRLGRVGKTVPEIFDAGAVDAVRAKLTFRRSAKVQEHISLVYPLAVQNQIVAAMNLAAALGAPKVTADLVQEV